MRTYSHEYTSVLADQRQSELLQAKAIQSNKKATRRFVIKETELHTVYYLVVLTN